MSGRGNGASLMNGCMLIVPLRKNKKTSGQMQCMNIVKFYGATAKSLSKHVHCL